MAPYSMDLRKRVARAWDAGLDADTVAAKYDVSRAWVHRLIQRRRETGSLAPRKQTAVRRRVPTDRMIEVGQGALDPRVAPVAVFHGHAHDQRSDLRYDRR